MFVYISQKSTSHQHHLPRLITIHYFLPTIYLAFLASPHSSLFHSLDSQVATLFSLTAYYTAFIMLSFVWALALLPAVFGAPSQQPEHSLSKRCTNSASDRTCWGDYDISTNYYDEVPDTGVTREYWLNVVNTTASPDGIERVVLAVNGSVPGPTLIGDWGDNFIVHVTNSMENNGSSIHFHGIRQNYTNVCLFQPTLLPFEYTILTTLPGERRCPLHHSMPHRSR